MSDVGAPRKLGSLRDSKRGSGDVDNMTGSFDQTFTDALATAKEYDEYATVINGMPIAAARTACAKEGISPRDDSLLGLRAALLLHFCGPPPTNETMRAARSERAAQMKGGGRQRRKKQPQLWHWAEFRRLVGQPAITDDQYRERIEGMAFQQWTLACRRLGLPTEGLSASAIRDKLLTYFVKDDKKNTKKTVDLGSNQYGTNVRVGTHLKLGAVDYRDIIKMMTESQAVNAARIEVRIQRDMQAMYIRQRCLYLDVCRCVRDSKLCRLSGPRTQSKLRYERTCVKGRQRWWRKGSFTWGLWQV
jgi:hypothetical protein